ncbi:MAG: M61 family metallopeptidase [Ignavibacteria bacterium]|nr:M61 family metallopeptidase [Ignavibacteria bacterium]
MKKEISYKLSFPERQAHYCEVSISVSDPENTVTIFSMPVWTPGSYLIREFSRNADRVKATASDGENLKAEKVNKNTWNVFNPEKKDFTFSYRVYGNELTVRTTRINSNHAFISSAGVFMAVCGMEECRCMLTVELPKEWKKISTGLSKISENVFYADNFDILIDSPLEIGNQNILEFEIQGIKHFICLIGEGNYKDEIIINDFRKIAEEQIKFFGGKIPYEHYTFIIHLVEKGGGGLEHLNSFVAQFPRLNFSDEKLYKKFLGLVSHEYFHLWNVKRIRPFELGPFDYSKENYTKSLWIAEGWTSFFDNVFIRRCGLINDEEYFEFIENEYNDVMRFKGRFHQSLSESSFDTWIKFYRKDENFSNTQISYYTKGALVAMMLNIEIIKKTNCEKSLDDVMRILYKDYEDVRSKGYTQERIKEVCESVNGGKLNEFWKMYVDGTDEIPVEEFLSFAGIEVTDTSDSASAALGIESKTENGKLIITKVIDGGSAYESGLSFRDEIISVNSFRVNEDNIKNILSEKKPGDEIKVIISREGLIKEIPVTLRKPIPKFKIMRMENISDEQEKVFQKWIPG